MKISSTAKRLNDIMEKEHIKQVDILEKAKPFCKQFGIKLTKTDLSQYVSGKVEPGQFKLFALAYALNVSELWLMGFDVSKERTHTINVPHQDFDQEALYAVKLLAEYSGYDFRIFANQYQLSNSDFIVKLSANEVEDYVNSVIQQVHVVTDSIVSNKLNENIVSIHQDRFVLGGIQSSSSSSVVDFSHEHVSTLKLNAAHERTDIEVTDEMRTHDDGIMDDEDF